MKNLSKLLSFVLILPLLVSTISFIASATESGTCGENLTWNFDNSTATLTIDGNGAMTDWQDYSNKPWYDIMEKIEKVIINDGVTSVGENAFSCCYLLKEIELPESIVSIGDYSFQQCYSLAEIVIPEGVITVGISAFSYCEKIITIEIPSTVTAYNDSFYQCKSLQNIVVSENNGYYSSDEYGVFYNKEKTQLIRYPVNNINSSYTIPEGVEHISENAFMNCANLTNVIIPKTVTVIDDFAFAYSGLNEVEISSVETISPYAFFFCFNLERVIISGSSVIQIGERAFELCEKLKYIHIPSSVNSIGADSFATTSAYICSDTDACYAKTYADNNGISFVVCKGEHKETDLPDVPDTPVIPPVETKTLSSISIKTFPKKTEYVVGEDFNANGLEIAAVYSDGTTVLISDYILTGFDSSKSGTCTVLVSYSENGVTQTCDFTITVNVVEDNQNPVTDKSVLTSILEFLKGILSYVAKGLKFLLDLFE